jgi:hypothetical protein
MRKRGGTGRRSRQRWRNRYEKEDEEVEEHHEENTILNKEDVDEMDSAIVTVRGNHTILMRVMSMIEDNIVLLVVWRQQLKKMTAKKWRRRRRRIKGRRKR